MSLRRTLPRVLRYAVAAMSMAGFAMAAAGGATGWQDTGRPLPERSAPRPDLDPDLRPFRPCPVMGGATITGTAPAILPDLVGRWVEAFATAVPVVKVEIPPPHGSPQGALNPRLDRFLRGSGDFAFLTRAMSLDDRATFEASHGHEPLVIPVAGGSFAHLGFVDPVVIVVNDANPVERLDAIDLQRLFSAEVPESGRPLTWADLGVAQWPDQPVRIVGGAGWSGAPSARGLVVRERLLQGHRLRSDLGPDSGTEAEVPARVASDAQAIGFTGLGHLVPGIRPLPIGNVAGQFLLPTFENVASAEYPLARTVDLVLATRAGRPLEPAMAEFVRFLLSRDGQAIVRDQGVFLPLRAFQATAASEAVSLVAHGCGATSGRARRPD